MPFAATIVYHYTRSGVAIDFIKEELTSDHPLAYHKLETDGLDLFVEEYGQLINVSQAGQLVLREPCCRRTYNASIEIRLVMP